MALHLRSLAVLFVVVVIGGTLLIAGNGGSDQGSEAAADQARTCPELPPPVPDQIPAEGWALRPATQPVADVEAIDSEVLRNETAPDLAPVLAPADGSEGSIISQDVASEVATAPNWREATKTVQLARLSAGAMRFFDGEDEWVPDDHPVWVVNHRFSEPQVMRLGGTDYDRADGEGQTVAKCYFDAGVLIVDARTGVGMFSFVATSDGVAGTASQDGAVNGSVPSTTTTMSTLEAPTTTVVESPSTTTTTTAADSASNVPDEGATDGGT